MVLCCDPLAIALTASRANKFDKRLTMPPGHWRYSLRGGQSLYGNPAVTGPVQYVFARLN